MAHGHRLKVAMGACMRHVRPDRCHRIQPGPKRSGWSRKGSWFVSVSGCFATIS